jgi:NAD(P)-dependent dehydrogenase (short-subunit alcohol dehydrogenase family)
VNFTGLIGGFADYWAMPWLRSRVEVLGGFGGATGVMTNLSVDAVIPCWKARISALRKSNRSHRVLPGPTKSRGVVDFVGALTQGSDKSFEDFETEFFEKVRPTSLIKRFAAPEEVAALVTFIASPLASATTGAALRVDGGVVKSAF